MRNPDVISYGNVIDIIPVVIRARKEPILVETDEIIEDLFDREMYEESLEEAAEAIRINEEAARLIGEF